MICICIGREHHNKKLCYEQLIAIELSVQGPILTSGLN